MVLLGWQSLLALLMANDVFAAQPLIAEPISSRALELRQADPTKCESNSYTSQNGLNFTTYCGQNNPFNDAQDPFKSPSFADCMEHCSRYWGNGEGCFGVVWVEANNNCWLRNSTTSTKNMKPEERHFSALTVTGNMNGFDKSCPGPDKSVQELAGVEGLKYTINCGKVIGGSDGCFSGFPKPCLEDPYRGFFHTKTLEECLRICVDQQPLCKAVSWNPGLEIGFANCWPKTGYDNLATPGPKMGVLHSATITQIDPIDRSCPSAKTYKSPGGDKTFELHCGQLNTGTNITSLHTQNVTACMDACARSDEKCLGILFDPTLSGGFKNCYLQNTTNTISDQPSATYAALTLSSSTPPNSNNPSSDTSSSSSSSSSSSKAWIAGPIVGGLAAIGLLAFAATWWRRRKASRQAAPLEKDGHEFHGAYGPAPAYSPGGDRGQGQTQHAAFGNVGATELSGNDVVANELPANTKYAQYKQGVTHELPS